MNKLDLSKLRFRIGDTVLYFGFQCKILAYFLDAEYLGYTIDVSSIDLIYCHDGTSCSVDEIGNSVDPQCDACLYVVDSWLEPINK